MTNTERADAALVALWEYDKAKGNDGVLNDVPIVQETMIDLIADLEHLAKREGISFVGVLSMARKHVIEERAGR